MTTAWLGLLVVLQAADFGTFLVMIARHGLEAEINPVVVALVSQHGLALLTLGKVLAVLVVVATFVVLARSRPKLAGATLAAGILMGALGTVSNLATI